MISGQDMKNMRLAHGKTQKDLAKALEIAPNTVARLERGEIEMTDAMADKLQTVFNAWDVSRLTGQPIPDSRIPTRDPVVQEIDRQLGGHVDREAFEAAMVDLLRRDEFPSAATVYGGKDGGFDGVVHLDFGGGSGRAQIIATTRKDDYGVRTNFKQSVQSADDQGAESGRQVIFITSAHLPPKQKAKMYKLADELGVRMMRLYDRYDIALRMRAFPDISQSLLGVSGAPVALAATPVAERGGPGAQGSLRGRGKELRWLTHRSDDCILAGQPGIGKTALLALLASEGKALFLIGDDEAQTANDVRSMKPDAIIVEDAHLDEGWEKTQMLRRIRKTTAAQFRIIASCWPGEFLERVQTGLGIAGENMLELDRLGAKAVEAIIRDASGGRIPDAWASAIRQQADGRPGLAVALTHSCLAGGDAREALTGREMCRRLLTQIDSKRESRQILAVMALGGGAGMSPALAADALDVPARDMMRLLADWETAHGVVECVQPAYDSWDAVVKGRLTHRHGELLAVVPHSLRCELVKRSADGWTRMGLWGKLAPIILADERRSAALMTLIGAAMRGADIPGLRQWVADQQDKDVWTQYAYLGERAAVEAWRERPEMARALADPLLHAAPEHAVALILDRIAEMRKSGETKCNLTDLRPQQREMLNSVLEWTSGNTEQPMRNRRLVIGDSADWIRRQNQGDINPGVASMCIAMLPTWECGVDAPSGWSHTLYGGLLSLPQLRKLAEQWDCLRKAIPAGKDDLEMWDLLLSLVDQWAFPRGMGVKPDADDAAFMRECTVRMLNDLATLAEGNRGVVLRIMELAESVGLPPLDIGNDVDQVFAALNPTLSLRHADQWAEREQVVREEAAALGREWAAKPVAEMVRVLKESRRDARILRVANRGWRVDAMRDFCFGAANAMQSGHAEAVTALLDAQVLDNQIIEPFLKACVKHQEEGWDAAWRKCLASGDCTYVAVETALLDKKADAAVGDAAFDAWLKMPMAESAGQHWAFYGWIPTKRLLDALRLIERDEERLGRVAMHVAAGHWQFTGGGKRMEAEVLDAWRNAVARSAHLDAKPNDHCIHWIGEALAKDGSLALEWFRHALVARQAHGGMGLDDAAKQAISGMTKAQRSQLLDMADECGLSAVGYFFALAWVPECIGDDADLYAKLLESEVLKEAHGLPLAGDMNTEGWRRKAVAALDAGLDPGVVASWCGPGRSEMGFCGDMSQHWERQMLAFDAVANGADARLGKVGRMGEKVMRQRMDAALERERLEKRRGIGES